MLAVTGGASTQSRVGERVLVLLLHLPRRSRHRRSLWLGYLPSGARFAGAGDPPAPQLLHGSHWKREFLSRRSRRRSW